MTLKDRRIRVAFSRTYRLINGEYAKIEAEESGTVDGNREDEWDNLHDLLEKQFVKARQRFRRYIKNEPR